jgi:very-short-patch-repair endonuclease
VTPFEADRRLLQVAAAQHNVVDLDALREVGLDGKAISRRVAAGRLIRLHRGVYLVGAVTRWSYEQAGLLVCGEAGTLSLGSAAAVWEVRPQLPQFVDVTMTRGHRRSRPGLTIHRAQVDDVCIRYGMRVTSPLRTLKDLAASRIDAGDLERTVHEALVARLVTRAEVEAVPALRAASHITPHVTRSELQRAMLALIRRVGLSEPVTEAIVHGHPVDFLWPEQRLVVETDGFTAHGTTRRRFETDRARDAKLTAAGYRVLRFTYRQITEQPEIVAARLAAALALATAGPALNPGWAA